jgi:hypothetical protein
LFATGGNATANHLSDTTTRWSLDADVAGNAPSSLGTLDSCVVAAADTDVTIDVTAEDIPLLDTHGTLETADDTGQIIGFHFGLTYDGAALSVVSVDTDQLLFSLPGGNPFPVGDPLPDSDGTYELDNADLSEERESGSGVIARVTLHVAAGALPGPYTLGLTEPYHIDVINTARAAPVYYSAQIAVGVACPGPALGGDVDCSGSVTAVDALKILRFGAGLSVDHTEPCNHVGTQSPGVGDVDCSNNTDSVDALKVLRFGAGLGYTKVHFCDDIGA